MDNELQGATFSDLALNLHIVATDVKSQQPVIFDKEHTPDLKVAPQYAIQWVFLYCLHLKTTNRNC